MARGGRKGRARPARDTGRPETPVVAPDDAPDSPSTEQGEKSNETVDASNVEAANKQQHDSFLPTPEAAAMKSLVKGTYAAMADLEEDSLSKLGSLLGIPIKTDKFTRDKTILKYARLLIEMKLQDSFLEYIDFVNEHDMVVRQKVEYEWKPSKCNFCRMYGHSDAECRKKPIPRTEWRPVTRTPPGPSAPTQPSTDADGFTQVRRQTTGIVSKEQSTPSHLQGTPLQNSFSSLAEVQQATGTEGEGLPQWKKSAART
ncbi:hypothetical protein Cgig2_002736 [Carnegiea gigantea]|uniref:DUF4283 domain-containing protein n=1 Tax=Carnegiea gigantea TaxID=171969 RepID=A0A9Q1JND4_9CARY|nr:hypothetical protein Cgig2_002736 [Carnegiea gigantea]